MKALQGVMAWRARTARGPLQIAVVGIVCLVRYSLHPQPAGSPAAQPQTGAPAARSAESPQTILKRRYAAGEIDRDLYLQVLDELGEG